MSRLGRYGHHICQVATVTHVATVARVATVAPRSCAAGILLLSNNSVRIGKKTTLHHFQDQFVNAV
jgi:hypothetical protein